MKKYFIGVLAALMLFAFTACEPQTIAWPTDKDVSYLEIVQVKDFIKGEIPTRDGFNVIIHYTDGEPETVPGAVIVTPADEPKEGYTVTSQLDFDTTEKTVPVIGVDTVKFETVTSVSITGASNVTVVDQTLLSAIHEISEAVKEKVLSFAGDPVFTLNYENGSKSFTLADEAAGKFDYILNVYEGTSTKEMATTDKFEKGNTYTVKVASYELADGKMYDVENSTADFAITVVDKPNDTPVPVSMGYRFWTFDEKATGENKLVETDTIWADNILVDSKAGIAKAGDVFIELYMTYSGEEQPTVLDPEDVSIWYNTGSGSDADKGTTLPDAIEYGKTYKVTVRYNDAKAGVDDLNFTLSSEDYVTDLTVSESNIYVKKGGALQKSDITVTAGHAVESKDEEDFKNYTIIGGSVPANAVDGQTFEAYIECVNEKGETVKSDAFTITVGTKSSDETK